MRLPSAAVRCLALVCLGCGFCLGVPTLSGAADTIPAIGGDIVITPLAHASVQVEHRGLVIQVDPWSLAGLERAKSADLILVTDDPGHHLDVTAIQQLRKEGAPVVIPANGQKLVPDGVVLANGVSRVLAGVRVEAIAAYDIKPGEPYHPKGEANGYLITLGGKRLYFAGVTECVPEIQALVDIDVAFMPMNLPVGRMTPEATAACVKTFKPHIVYLTHYDNAAAASMTKRQPVVVSQEVKESLAAFEAALKGQPIEVRHADWYPSR